MLYCTHIHTLITRHTHCRHSILFIYLHNRINIPKCIIYFPLFDILRKKYKNNKYENEDEERNQQRRKKAKNGVKEGDGRQKQKKRENNQKLVLI